MASRGTNWEASHRASSRRGKTGSIKRGTCMLRRASAVLEYNTAGNLTATYSASLSGARGVTTDRRGNVYVADYNGVHEFPQGHNVDFTCTTGGANDVAVDKS